MLMKTGPKIDEVTSNNPERFSVFLTKGKTKVIYFPCHEHQKGLTLFLAKGRKMKIIAAVILLSAHAHCILQNMGKDFDYPSWNNVPKVILKAAVDMKVLLISNNYTFSFLLLHFYNGNVF
jgi:hypothetical protein